MPVRDDANPAKVKLVDAKWTHTPDARAAKPTAAFAMSPNQSRAARRSEDERDGADFVVGCAVLGDLTSVVAARDGRPIEQSSRVAWRCCSWTSVPARQRTGCRRSVAAPGFGRNCRRRCGGSSPAGERRSIAPRRRSYSWRVARVVFATMGSWGDLFPTVGLAKAVAARGHAVCLATTSAYGSLVEDEGLWFVPVGPRYGPEEFAADPAILDGRHGGYAGFLHLFRTVVFPNLISWVEDLRGALEGADLLISHPTVLASPIAAELTGTRWMTFSVFPGLIPSERTLPSPTRVRLPRGPVGRAICRSAWRTARWNIRRSFDPAVNAARVAVRASARSRRAVSPDQFA